MGKYFLRDTWETKLEEDHGRVINIWADIIIRANLGIEVMHERNAHNFPLDLAAAEVSLNG
uniref:Uncharacterized protein n=1 Tax=Kalanchoe fedtschenkoi TaxID=63787 RepID=A0A7N0V8D7_KALFE